MDDEIQFLFPPDFWTAVHNRRMDGQRQGQAVFNTAAHEWPEYVAPLVGSSYDPFYRDEKVNDFLTILSERITAPKKPRE